MHQITTLKFSGNLDAVTSLNNIFLSRLQLKPTGRVSANSPLLLPRWTSHRVLSGVPHDSRIIFLFWVFFFFPLCGRIRPNLLQNVCSPAAKSSSCSCILIWSDCSWNGWSLRQRGGSGGGRARLMDKGRSENKQSRRSKQGCATFHFSGREGSDAHARKVKLEPSQKIQIYCILFYVNKVRKWDSRLDIFERLRHCKLGEFL